MDINNNSNITSAVATSLSKLNLSSTPRAQQKTSVNETEQVAVDIKEEDTKLMGNRKIQNSIDVADIQKYANYMGENLTIEDINYGLMYGRSVIADYSV